MKQDFKSFRIFIIIKYKLTPTVSMFYGIIIRMMFFDTKQYHLPPIHVEYQGEKAAFTIPDGKLPEGSIRKKTSLVKARIILHEEELMADWTLAVNGEPVFQIKPLQ